MDPKYYELLVLAARYAFTLLGVIVVWRSILWLHQDARQRKQAHAFLPDAGYVGTLYVIAGQSKSMKPGDAFPVPMEGVLGRGAGCDIRIINPTVARRHALFEFRPDGLHMRAYRDERIQVDDQTIPQGCEAILQHGASLAVGGVMLQLRLYAGVQVSGVRLAMGHADREETKSLPRPIRIRKERQGPIQAKATDSHVPPPSAHAANNQTHIHAGEDDNPIYGQRGR